MPDISSNEIEFAQIEPTTRCNFTCGFCCGRKMKQRDIGFESFCRTLDAYPYLKHIELQGEGEPLLHPLFFQMARYARAKGIKLSMITNGSLLKTKDTISNILSVGFEKISISIESADVRRFKMIRGGKLERVTSGIAALLAERNRRGLSRPVVDFAVTVLESTVESFSDIVVLYEQLGMDGGINTQLLQRMEAYVASYEPAMVADLVTRESAVRFRDLRADAERRIGPPKKLGFYKELFADAGADLNVCPWLERGIFVAANGDTSPCCKIKDTVKYGYGSIDAADTDRYHLVRNRMRGQLHDGEVPASCVGCPGAEQFRGLPDRLAKGEVGLASELDRLAEKNVIADRGQTLR